MTPSVVETGERLRAEIRKAKSLTDRPFGVNLVLMKTSKDFPEATFP